MRKSGRGSSGNPADLSAPLKFSCVLVRLISRAHWRFSSVGDHDLGKRRKPHCEAPFFDSVGIFENIRLESVGAATKLGTVPLGLSLEDPDAVVDERELPARRISSRNRLIEELATRPHEVGLTNRVLSDSPGRLSAGGTDERLARPSDQSDDLTKSGRIGTVERLHPRMVTLEKRTVGGQFGAH